MVNYYELLDIDNNASKDVIKAAYKKMVKKYHPDVSKDKDSEKIIRSLNEAKETLLDDNKRREYDLSLNSINEAKQFSKEKEDSAEYLVHIILLSMAFLINHQYLFGMFNLYSGSYSQKVLWDSCSQNRRKTMVAFHAHVLYQLLAV